MSDLNLFAELIRKGKEDAQRKELHESERKQKELGPLLTGLFQSVAKAKIIEGKRAAVVDKLDELEAKQITSDTVTELVSERIDALGQTTEQKLIQTVRKLQGISTSGGSGTTGPTADEIADAVWNRGINTLTDKNTIGGFISKVLLTIPKFLGLK